MAICSQSIREAEDARRTEVSQLVLRNHVVEFEPLWLLGWVLIGLSQVERVDVRVQWHHELLVPVDNRERRIAVASGRA